MSVRGDEDFKRKTRQQEQVLSAPRGGRPNNSVKGRAGKVLAELPAADAEGHPPSTRKRPPLVWDPQVRFGGTQPASRHGRAGPIHQQLQRGLGKQRTPRDTQFTGQKATSQGRAGPPKQQLNLN